jgi:hypothetical protein
VGEGLNYPEMVGAQLSDMIMKEEKAGLRYLDVILEL